MNLNKTDIIDITVADKYLKAVEMVDEITLDKIENIRQLLPDIDKYDKIRELLGDIEYDLQSVIE